MTKFLLLYTNLTPGLSGRRLFTVDLRISTILGVTLGANTTEEKETGECVVMKRTPRVQCNKSRSPSPHLGTRARDPRGNRKIYD